MRYNDNEVKRNRKKYKIKEIDFENESKNRAASRKKLNTAGISFIVLGIILFIVSIVLAFLLQASVVVIISAAGVALIAGGAVLCFCL